MGNAAILIPLLFAFVVLLGVLLYFASTFTLWLQGFLSGANVGLVHLIGMKARRSPAREIMRAHIMMIQASLKPPQSASLHELESHALAGGDVLSVASEVISAARAGKQVAFNEAAARDLAKSDERVMAPSGKGLDPGRSEPSVEIPAGAHAFADSTIPPVGKIIIDGKQHDAISEDIEIRRGEQVEIVSRLPGLVIVRRR